MKKSGGHMLALTRKKGESIIIGDNIEIVILGIAGEQVKIGIHAPRDISVHRQEVYEQIQNENKAAVKNSSIFSLNAAKNLMK